MTEVSCIIHSCAEDLNDPKTQVPKRIEKLIREIRNKKPQFGFQLNKLLKAVIERFEADVGDPSESDEVFELTKAVENLRMEDDENPSESENRDERDTQSLMDEAKKRYDEQELFLFLIAFAWREEFSKIKAKVNEVEDLLSSFPQK